MSTTMQFFFAATATLCLTAVSAAGAAGVKTNFPVIAIMSHRHSQAGNPKCGAVCDTIEASYVKWVEGAGGRAVAVPYAATDAHVEDIFSSVNGLLLPGGGDALSPAASHFLSLARAANADGKDYFPVWGTCLGFEWLLQFQANSTFLDNGFDSENLTLALDFSAYGAGASRMFNGAAHAGFDTKAVQAMFADKANPPTMNNHRSGLEPAHLTGNPLLNGFYKIVATNEDRTGRAFVSAIEAADPRQPFYGTQFHPEKSQYEFGMVVDGAAAGGGVAPGEYPFEVINHSREAVLASQFLAGFFVDECRKSGHHYPTAEAEQAALMYNFVSDEGTYEAPEFVQTYYLHYP